MKPGHFFLLVSTLLGVTFLGNNAGSVESKEANSIPNQVADSTADPDRHHDLPATFEIGEEKKSPELSKAWSAWYRQCQGALLQILISRVTGPGRALVKVTVTKAKSVSTQIVECTGDARFRLALISAFTDINGNPGLTFPTASSLNQVNFVFDYPPKILTGLQQSVGQQHSPRNMRTINFKTGWIKKTDGFHPTVFLELENRNEFPLVENTVKIQGKFLDKRKLSSATTRMVLNKTLRPKERCSIELSSPTAESQPFPAAECKVMARVGNVNDDQTEYLLVTEIDNAAKDQSKCLAELKQGEADQAKILSDIEKIEHSNYSEVQLNNDGVNYMKANMYEDASIALKKALKLNPHYRLALENLSICYNNFGIIKQKPDPKAALRHFRTSLYLWPNAQARVNLNKQLTEFNKNPTDFQQRVQMAKEAATAGDTLSAITEYREALKLKPDPEIQLKLKALRAPADLPDTRNLQVDEFSNRQILRPPAEPPPSRFSVCMSNGFSSIYSGDVEKAIAEFSAAMKLIPQSEKSLVQSRTPDEERVYATTEGCRGVAYKISNQLNLAESDFQNAAQSFRNLKEGDGLSLGLLMNDMAITQFRMQKYKEALSTADESERILSRFSGISTLTRSSLAMTMASMKSAGGPINPLEKCRQARFLRLNMLGLQHPAIVYGMGKVSLSRSKIDEFFEKSKTDLAQVERSLVGLKPDSSLAAAIEFHASLLSMKNDFVESERLLLKALEIREDLGGKDKFESFQTLCLLGNCYLSTKRPSEARNAYERCQKIVDNPFAGGYIVYPLCLDAFFFEGIAKAFELESKFTEAEVYYQKALKCREKWLWAEHLDVAMSLVNLSSFYARQKQDEKAIPLIERERKILKEVFSEKFVEKLPSPTANCEGFRKEGLIVDTSKVIESSPQILVLLDCSKHMQDSYDKNSTCMDASRELINRLLSTLPFHVSVTVRVFGHREGDCLQSDLVSSFDANNRSALRTALKELKPSGRASLTYALTQAEKDFNRRDSQHKLVLLSSGFDDCGADTIGYVRKLKSDKQANYLYVMNLSKNSTRAGKLTSQIAQEYGSKLYDVAQTDELITDLMESQP